MAKVEAWRCDGCGKEVPANGTTLAPEGWLTVLWMQGGKQIRHFCKAPCLVATFEKWEGPR